MSSMDGFGSVGNKRDRFVLDSGRGEEASDLLVATVIPLVRISVSGSFDCEQ